MKINAVAQDANPLTLAAARAEFDADVTYLDTATFGLPPRPSWVALCCPALGMPMRAALGMLMWGRWEAPPRLCAAGLCRCGAGGCGRGAAGYPSVTSVTAERAAVSSTMALPAA